MAVTQTHHLSPLLGSAATRSMSMRLPLAWA